MEFSQLFQAFFEEASDAMLAVNLDKGLIIRANKTLCNLYGFAREEVEGEKLNILHTSVPTGMERERPLSIQVIEHEGYYNDIIIAPKNGEARFASVRVRHLDIEGENFAIAVLSDDTERQLMMRDLVAKHQSMEQAYLELGNVHSELKSTQEKMTQVSKLVALGELAAGMSHELNQPLTGVRGFAQELEDILSSEKRPKRKEVIGLTKEIITNADKMASLLSHLRDFARQEKNNFNTATDSRTEKVSLKVAVDNVLKLLDKQLEDQKVKVFTDVPGSLSALAQIHPVEQVLINLLTNSRDAVIDKHAASGKGRIDIQAWEENQKVFLRVSDNGCGVAEELRGRIFDPFFSTKDQGEGMGLGLSISFSIIHNFKGQIQIEESGPNGTSFLITLPTANSKTLREAA
ncbi:PAS domain S-box protein [bacterium]|nr:PAS domain S-box protein [bacterium]